MPRRLLFAALILFSSWMAFAQPCREVIAFYPSWKWYDRGRLVNPANIDYSKYTVINYAFFEPNSDGSISCFDPKADKTLLLGEIRKGAPGSYEKDKDLIRMDWHIPGTSLVHKAHENGVKVVISVGGWTMSHHFSSIAADEAKRRNFAGSCAGLIKKYDVDGIDIDWEYPGMTRQGGSSRDKQNFTRLLEAVRHALDLAESEVGKDLLLMADFGVSTAHMQQIEWDMVVPLLDYVNLMTYDYYGSRPSYTNHHAPLYPPRRGVEGYDLHNSVHVLRDQFGVPSEKINIGLAFFGRSIKTKKKPDLHAASLASVDAKTFPEDKGAPSFYNILQRQELFETYWDDLAKVPYMKGKKLNTFVTFENERSISLKARYVLDHNLAGAIVWDITCDYVEKPGEKGKVGHTPLADALSTALCEMSEAEDNSRAGENELETLQQIWSPVVKKSFAPRLLLPINKKEAKRLRRQNKKALKKRLRNRGDVPGRYFDGGW